MYTIFDYRKGLIVILAMFLLASCAQHHDLHSAKKPTIHGDVSVTTESKPSIESKLYITQVGEVTTIKVPSSLFFVKNTANIKKNFQPNIASISQVIQRYEPSVIKVEVVFPTSKNDNVAKAIANNQAQKFADRIEEYVHKHVVYSASRLINEKQNFNHSYQRIGNYLNITLHPAGYGI